MCGHTRDPIISSKFHRNPFRGFGAPVGQNLAFPITFNDAFTTACTTVQAVMIVGVIMTFFSAHLSGIVYCHC